MKLPDWSITHSPIVYTAVALLMLWGIFSFFTMPRREDPEYTIRTCVISTSWPGTPVTKVEELITDKLEEAVDSIEEVDVVRSTTTVGLSTIYVDLDDSTPADAIQNVWDKVRARIDKVPMPEEGLKPIVNDEFGDTAVLLLAIHQIPLNGAEQIDDQNRYSFRELEDFADLVKDELRLLDGAAKVEKFGVRDEAIYIETDLANWSQLGLTTNELSSLVSSRNIVETGGAIDTPDTRYSVFPSGEFNAVAELESIIADYVSSGPSRTPVYLTDLNLAVKRSYQDPPGLICRYGDVNGTYDAVMLGLTMKSGSNIVDLCNLAKARIQQMQEVEQILPPDLAVTPVSDQSLNVSAKISDVIVNVIEAVLIVVLVVLLMVGLRTSVVMAANIPIVVLASIGMITLFGVQLEQISLASIIIALGLLVDNAVQVCDQSRTNQIEGAAPIPATVAGANTLAIPMLTGTLTTVAAFLPMLFALEGGG
ncbi:MAG: efflux RND transporter permease subunit, partial [Planctomycetaceae bacterium]|nr:efflux RND transporter permease subunit [Planctomycetaceae bacterium]